ncbi:MAG: MFS transporter [Planctomycetota bacterium]|jgi:MFS family permease
MDETIRQTKTGRLVIRAAHRRGSIRAAIFTSITHTLGATCLLGGTLQLYAISQGADDLFLGLLACAVWMGAPFLLIGMSLMRRYGKRRILILWTGILPAVSLAIVVVLPFVGHMGWLSNRLILYLLIAAVLVRSITDSIGGAGWFPLMQDNVPSRIAGKFFGIFRMYWQSCVLLATLLMAWFLGKEPDWWKFCVIFAVGELAFIIKIYFLHQLKEKPIENQTTAPPSTWRAVRRALTDPRMRYFLGYTLIYNIAAFMCLPFQIKSLKSLGYGDGFILFATSMISLGAIVSLRYWGRLADRFGNRPVFNFSHLGIMVAIASWLLVGNNLFSAIFVFVLYGLWSIFQSANGIAQTRYMMQAVPETDQSAIVVIHAVSFFSIGLAPLIGGLCLRLLSEVQIDSGAIQMNRYHLLFVFSALLISVPHWMHKHFQVDHESSAYAVFAIVTRPLRTLFGSFIVLPNRRNK